MFRVDETHHLTHLFAACRINHYKVARLHTGEIRAVEVIQLAKFLKTYPYHCGIGLRVFALYFLYGIGLNIQLYPPVKLMSDDQDHTASQASAQESALEVPPASRSEDHKRKKWYITR